MIDKTELPLINRRRVSPSPIHSLFLRYYFVLPSYLQRQIMVLAAYAGLCLLGLALYLASPGAGLQALSLGLTFPGAGFLHWTGEGQWLAAFAACVVAFSLFAASLLVWFGTGNVVLPPLVWAAAALAAAYPEWFGLRQALGATPWAQTLPFASPLLAMTLFAISRTRRSLAAVGAMPPEKHLLPAEALPLRREIALEDLHRLRLLLDRALQPVGQFDGFEWRDQFQTAAVRYQLNFISYALSAAQANYLPAANAQYDEAQRRLLEKQGDPKIWRYWALENAWGNLRLNRDPVPRDNIMFTGFVGLQMGLARTGAPLVLRGRRGPWRSYGLSEMADILAAQYRKAPHGLVACEPNWIYPLCNLITACGLRAADCQDGGQRWSGMADQFRDSLCRNFTSNSGHFIAFRSSLTGFAPPSPGGAVMRAFPCLFLNSLYPDMAATQWERLRQWLVGRNMQRAFWPIDVGNYGFSRASSYAASAAAAVEMGDGGIANMLLPRLEAECPSQAQFGVTCRRHASLWAHALELAARLGRKDGLRALVESRPRDDGGPRLVTASYPDVLIARAVSDGSMLDLVLHPGTGFTATAIGLAGLIPGQQYRTGPGKYQVLRANHVGEAVLDIHLAGRTPITVTPVH